MEMIMRKKCYVYFFRNLSQRWKGGDTAKYTQGHVHIQHYHFVYLALPLNVPRNADGYPHSLGKNRHKEGKSVT